VFLPTGGPPNVATADGQIRPATLVDYQNCCKLVQTSDQLDMNGSIMVQPMDIPSRAAHLEMLLANMTLCDKAYLGVAMSRESAQDSLEMAAILAGGPENLKKTAMVPMIISIATPLRYAQDEAEAIIDQARMNQPVVLTNLVMAGSSGPLSLPGVMALSNAEILAGVVLAQVAGPGTPVVYGSVSAPADMRTMTTAVGAPEAVILASATIQLARHYRLPSRSGGMLTSAHIPDAQAAAEGTLLMSTAVRGGVNFILHACGQLGSYISLSFEKWLIDEDVCRSIRRALSPVRITPESIDVDTIKRVGSDGNYLTEPSTFKQCRNLFQPRLFTRDDPNKWQARGGPTVLQQAAALLPARLAGYEKPLIDAGLEQALTEYVARKKASYLG